jgi:hypothetical protein
MNDMALYQIQAPYFFAGFETNKDGGIIKTAPILNYMKARGWELDQAVNYCQSKNWKIYHIPDDYHTQTPS